MLALAQADPPARVGRLAVIENAVNFRVDRNTERDAASLNWPISSGAILDTDWRGRAEVWIGSTAYRIAGNSEIEFSQLDDARIVINVTVGSLAVSIMDADQIKDLTVITRDGNVRFSSPGRYRIDVFSDHSEVTAQAGQAIAEVRNRPVAIAAGLKARLYQDQPPRIDNDFDQDNFDFWVADRENKTVADAARRYVSPQMTGYQDLDAHGDWRAEPEYGSVWYPRTVADDWAPYRFGRWAWVAPWGWTWIDQATWGFAPFHYGRWVLIQNRWAWSPGRNISRPIYAPALVGWIGNPGWSVNFSFGSAPAVGWFPLAPREVYVPAYRHSSSYIRQINHANVRDVKVIDRATKQGTRENFTYRNRQQAVTVVPANLLREGRPISRQEWRRPEAQALERAPQARQAPNQDWLAPADSARRPSPEARRETASGRAPRESNPAFRPNTDDRRATTPPPPVRSETANPYRQAPAAGPQSTPAIVPPDLMRENRRENPRFDQSTPRESDAPALRQRQAPAASAPRPLTDRAPTAPPALREERQARPAEPSAEREIRRERRDMRQTERSTPGAMESAPSRQRDASQIIPQAAPVLRAPPPPASAPQSQATPQPAREMPRQENRRNEKQSADRPQRRERDDGKEERGPR
ncbi:MAG: hypothetical protein CVU16_13590 [Betaproteobacteria bacterium HGW-Betaproteobacteria-10]|nr:MAG: hypothetical protein CVU16_13590 [Betaproteobacteria bacterium HGW-Betaproteobacteria-10]